MRENVRCRSQCRKEKTDTDSPCNKCLCVKPVWSTGDERRGQPPDGPAARLQHFHGILDLSQSVDLRAIYSSCQANYTDRAVNICLEPSHSVVLHIKRVFQSCVGGLVCMGSQQRTTNYFDLRRWNNERDLENNRMVRCVRTNSVYSTQVLGNRTRTVRADD